MARPRLRFGGQLEEGEWMAAGERAAWGGAWLGHAIGGVRCLGAWWGGVGVGGGADAAGCTCACAWPSRAALIQEGPVKRRVVARS